MKTVLILILSLTFVYSFSQNKIGKPKIIEKQQTIITKSKEKIPSDQLFFNGIWYIHGGAEIPLSCKLLFNVNSKNNLSIKVIKSEFDSYNVVVLYFDGVNLKIDLKGNGDWVGKYSFKYYKNKGNDYIKNAFISTVEGEEADWEPYIDKNK